MDAEQAYLFRHALVRDAAYELQPPGTRATLHGMVIEIIEAEFAQTPRHMALELADHAKTAHAERPGHPLAKRELEFLMIAGQHAFEAYRMEESRQAYQRIVDAPHASPRDRALANCELAVVYVESGRMKNARACCEQALKHGDALPEKKRIAAKGNLANVLKLEDDHDGAEKLYAEVIEESRQIGDSKMLPTSLGNLAALYEAAERHNEAIGLARELLGICTGETGNEADTALAHSLLARALGGIPEHYEESLKHYAVAIEMQTRLNDKRGLSSTLNNLGSLHWKRQDFQQSARCFERALACYREVGNDGYSGFALVNLALIHIQKEDGEGATRFGRQALALFTEVGAENWKQRLLTEWNDTRQKWASQGRMPPLPEL